MELRSSNGNNLKPKMDVTIHRLQGPQSHLIYATCHWVSVFKFWKHQKPVFIFHHSHPFFWVFESGKQWLKTQPNKCSTVGPIRFGWWIMKTKWYHSVFIPSKQALNTPTIWVQFYILSGESIQSNTISYRYIKSIILQTKHHFAETQFQKK